MEVSAIIAEYNPFHNGHKYHIEETRRRGATHIIAVMSGNTVQRGDISVFDKHFRAKCAAENGADLVVELPYPFSCSCAEIFAKGAVSIITRLGVVDTLSFGVETDNSFLLKNAAEASEALREDEEIKRLVSSGLSYPKAFENACRIRFGDETAECFTTPNNTLAIEYIKALSEEKSNIVPMAIERKNVGHDEMNMENGFASASMTRQLLAQGESTENILPYKLLKETPHFLKLMDKAVLISLSSKSVEELEQVPDISHEAAARIFSALNNGADSVDSLIEAVKCKSLTRSRLARSVLNAYFGLKGSDLALPPYCRILAFNQKGTELISKIKTNGSIDISTSLTELSRISPAHKRLAELDNLTSRFQALCCEEKLPLINEYSKMVTIIR